MRRWVWLIFAPVLFVMMALAVMLMGGLMSAFSFGSYAPRELEAAIAPLVLWPALGFAGLSYGAGRLQASLKAKRDPEAVSESGAISREISHVCMAIFFGGFAALAEAWNVWWTLALWLGLFLAWVVRIEAPQTQKKPGRRRWRIVAFVGVSLATWGVIHYASF